MEKCPIHDCDYVGGVYCPQCRGWDSGELPGQYQCHKCQTWFNTPEPFLDPVPRHERLCWNCMTVEELFLVKCQRPLVGTEILIYNEDRSITLAVPHLNPVYMEIEEAMDIQMKAFFYAFVMEDVLSVQAKWGIQPDPGW